MTVALRLNRNFAQVWTGSLWQRHVLLLSLSVAALLVLFAHDVGDMVTIWWTASTYNHCLFIPFITAWLVLQRRDEVAGFVPSVYAPGLIFLFGAALLWVLGEAAGIALFRQAAIVLMIQSLVLTLCGLTITRALLFPLFYLSFMVPAGEELVPALQTITAKMSMMLLGFAGVPAHINGIFITIPNGYFKVAEACSGVKFLVAMVAYGALVANLCFKSLVRRAAFMAMAILVPVLANGIRAFGTIYAAHLSTADAAAGFDHIVYGWFFFGFVMALVMGIGWCFFDRSISDPWLNGFVPSATKAKRQTALVAGLVLVILLFSFAWKSAIAANGATAMPNAIILPVAPGWSRVSATNGEPWAPQFIGADHLVVGHYTNSTKDQVDVAVALFGSQDEGRELVGYGQGAIGTNSRWSWASDATPPPHGMAQTLVAPGPVNREVVSFYFINGKLTGSQTDVKIETLKTKLFGRDQSAAVFMVSAVDSEERPARRAIDAFLANLGPVQKHVTDLIATSKGR